MFSVGIKRPLDDDYEEEDDDRKRRRGDGPKVELRFLLASKVGLNVYIYFTAGDFVHFLPNVI